jgi:hypothetical protein
MSRTARPAPKSNVLICRVVLVPNGGAARCSRKERQCGEELCGGADSSFDAPAVDSQALIEGVQNCLCADVRRAGLCVDHDALFQAHGVGVGGYHLAVQRVRHVRLDLVLQ